MLFTKIQIFYLIIAKKIQTTNQPTNRQGWKHIFLSRGDNIQFQINSNEHTGTLTFWCWLMGTWQEGQVGAHRKRGGTAAIGPIYVCAKFNDNQATVDEVFESGPLPHKTASQQRLKRVMSVIMLPKHYSFVCFIRKQSSRVKQCLPLRVCGQEAGEGSCTCHCSKASLAEVGKLFVRSSEDKFNYYCQKMTARVQICCLKNAVDFIILVEHANIYYLRLNTANIEPEWESFLQFQTWSKWRFTSICHTQSC